MFIDLHTLNFYTYLIVLILVILASLLLRDIFIFLILFEVYIIIGYYMLFFPLWLPLFFGVIIILYISMGHKIGVNIG